MSPQKVMMDLADVCAYILIEAWRKENFQIPYGSFARKPLQLEWLYVC